MNRLLPFVFVFLTSFSPYAMGQNPTPFADLRLLDTAIFGRKMSDRIAMVPPMKTDALAPCAIALDFKDDTVCGATVSYKRDIPLDKAVLAIEHRYRKSLELGDFIPGDNGGRWKCNGGKMLVLILDDKEQDRLQIIYVAQRLADSRVGVKKNAASP